MTKVRKKTIALILLLLLSLAWIIPVCHANLLTAIHGDRFENLEKIGFSGMHPWNGTPDYRVLYYSKNAAKVYYFSETGGEVALFINVNGQWNYQRSTKAWSSFGGTADDYLVWPYFKNWVI